VIPALLISVAAAVLTPGQQQAPVMAPALPPLRAGAITTNDCTKVTIPLHAPAGTKADGYGDLGDQPPWEFHDGYIAFVLNRQPGTVITWGVGLFGTYGQVIGGTYTVPPCLAPAVEPIVNPVAPPPAVRTHRGEVWGWVLKRWGMS
jgi:hypothetical protein